MYFDIEHIVLSALSCNEKQMTLIFTRATRSIARHLLRTWLGGWVGVCHSPVLYLNG